MSGWLPKANPTGKSGKVPMFKKALIGSRGHRGGIHRRGGHAALTSVMEAARKAWSMIPKAYRLFE
jgi:hypothetical protein